MWHYFCIFSGKARKTKIDMVGECAKYKARGASRAPEYNPSWDEELEQMSYKKVGRPYKYSHSMMAAIAICKAMLEVSFRIVEGELDSRWKGHDVPHFSQIWRRVGDAMPVFKKISGLDLLKKGTRCIIADSTDIKLSNRGEWIRLTVWEVSKWRLRTNWQRIQCLRACTWTTFP